jgi:hypothetical protein
MVKRAAIFTKDVRSLNKELIYMLINTKRTPAAKTQNTLRPEAIFFI